MDPSAPLEWSFNPWHERPAQAWGAAAVVIVTVALVAGAGLPALVTAALAAGLGAALGRALLPARCALDDAGVRWGVGPLVQRRPWSAFRRAVRAGDGVLLSPFSRRSRLDAYRAVFLPFPSRLAARLVPDIDARLARHGL